MKTCSVCAISKPLDAFSPKKSGGVYARCKECSSAQQQSYYRKNREYRESRKQWSRDNSRPAWKRHNLTDAQYDALVAKYDGKCHLCKKRDAYMIDHDHACCPGTWSCGQCVRGVLCNGCNSALGIFEDDPDLLAAAVDYLENTKAIGV
jgi:Recombination endonuclease VII